MRGRVWILLALAGLTLLLGSIPVFRDNHAESQGATFAGLLKKRYPGWDGFSSCPQSDLDCWGEIHDGARYRIVESQAGTFRVRASWTRAWHAAPTEELRTFGASGTGRSNAAGFDWGPLTGSVLVGLPARASAAPGGTPATAPPEIYIFNCVQAGKNARCSNQVGDVYVYKPGPKS